MLSEIPILDFLTHNSYNNQGHAEDVAFANHLPELTAFWNGMSDDEPNVI